MNKSAFYEAAQARDKDLERQSTWWAVVVLAAFLLPTALLLFPSSFGQGSFARGWAYLAYACAVLIVYIAATRRLRKRINARHGMLCQSCGKALEGAALVHVGFTGKCPACQELAYQAEQSQSAALYLPEERS